MNRILKREASWDGVGGGSLGRVSSAKLEQFRFNIIATRQINLAESALNQTAESSYWLDALKCTKR